MEARYRKDYDGEFVIINTDIRRGIKEQKREWISNSITNQHISGRAAVIGSAVDRDMFDYKKLQKHRGGLLSSKKLQTYGCGDVWKDLVLDFYCSTDRGILNKLQSQNYQDSSIVYTTARFCLIFPDNFYLIPFQPAINDLAAAIYMAAFDGHRDIYMLGYNEETPGNTKNWKQDVATVIQTYSQHQFFLVGAATNMPPAWRSLPNVECWDYRKFVTQCDV
jgi:hypothetical protein